MAREASKNHLRHTHHLAATWDAYQVCYNFLIINDGNSAVFFGTGSQTRMLRNGMVHPVIQGIIDDTSSGVIYPDITGFPVIQLIHGVVKPFRRRRGPGVIIGISQFALGYQSHKAIEGFILERIYLHLLIVI